MGKNLDVFGKVTPVIFNIPRMLERSYVEAPTNWAVVTDNGRICPPNGAYLN
jgi:hypothetical protein